MIKYAYEEKTHIPQVYMLHIQHDTISSITA